MRLGWLIVFLLILLSMAGYFLKKPPHELVSLFPIQNYDQNITNWINPKAVDYQKQLLTDNQQKKLTEEWYRHYYSDEATALSPWNPAYIKQIFAKKVPDDLATVEQEKITKYGNYPTTAANDIAYGANFRPYSSQWTEQIKTNMNLSQFKGLPQYDPTHRGIAIDNLNARIFPTVDVHFYNPKMAGEGYPFDNLQGSVLWAGEPVYILGESLDRAWYLVLTPEFYIAWVKSTGIAFVDDGFIKYWQQKAKANTAVMAWNDKSLIDEEANLYRFSSHLGMTFPVEKLTATTIEILIPTMNDQHQALIHHAQLKNDDVVIMPLSATIQHFSEIINHSINRTYGWGNMYFYNDCSSELRHLFVAFGVWLPRHSTEQVNEDRVPGRSVDLLNLDGKKRIEYLTNMGHPFMTIGYIGGHVFLYIGNYPNPRDQSQIMPLTFQSMWGLRPQNTSAEKDSRVVIGESVLFPLLKTYPDDPRLVSPADKKYFKIMYLDSMVQDMVQFQVKEFNNIDLRILTSP